MNLFMKDFHFSVIFRQKIIITRDNGPFSLLENGYKKLNLFDFLLNNNSLEEI